MQIVNVAIMDGTSDVIQRGKSVEVIAGRIAWIGDADEPRAESGMPVIDGTGLTLLPGLIDCHVHLGHDGEPDWTARRPQSAAEESLTVIRNASTTLRAGITTVRDCGSSAVRGPLALALRGAEAGIPLPRVISCGSPLTMTGGHLHWEAVEADGEEEIRKAVRSELKRGAQWIKVMATGGVLTPGTDVGSAAYSEDELAAAVEAANVGGRRVAAHAIGNAGIKNALRAGVASVEHGSYLDAEAIEMMLSRNAAHVPTLSAYDGVVSSGVDAGVPAESVSKATRANESNLDSFRASLSAGVRVCAGTDAGTPHNPHGRVAHELGLMVNAGATPFQAIQSATVNAAEMLSLSDDVGHVTPGKIADLLLVEGNPLTDIACLSHPAVVVRAGEIVVDRRGSIPSVTQVIAQIGA